MYEQALEIIKQEAAEQERYEEMTAECKFGSPQWYLFDRKRFNKEKEVNGQIYLVSKLFGVDLEELEKTIWES